MSMSNYYRKIFGVTKGEPKKDAVITEDKKPKPVLKKKVKKKVKKKGVSKETS